MKTINIIDILDIAWNPTGHNCLALLYGQTWTMMGRIDDGKRPSPPLPGDGRQVDIDARRVGSEWADTKMTSDGRGVDDYT